MNYPYSINDLASKCKVSKQSIYNLIKKNQDFINDNSTRKQRKIYYNQAVMDFFISYYSPEPSAEEHKTAEDPQESTSAEEQHETQLDTLKAENDALKAEIDTLRKQLDDKEAERQEMFRQNSALLLMLQQEKQEKMLLLPAPKKPLGEKIKGLFNRKQ